MEIRDLENRDSIILHLRQDYRVILHDNVMFYCVVLKPNCSWAT